MTLREQLAVLLPALSEANVADVLDFVRWLLEGEETLTTEEMADVQRGREEIARGEYVTLAELRQELGL